MRAVVQRVSSAAVEVEGETLGAIGRGFLVLVGVEKGDAQGDEDYMTEKLAGLRVFEDEAGKMNLDIGAVGGELLLVSQFTLLGDNRKGRRPNFSQAARPQEGEAAFNALVQRLKERNIPVQTGRFGAHMHVSLVNDGPVTILLDSKRLF